MRKRIYSNSVLYCTANRKTQFERCQLGVIESGCVGDRGRDRIIGFCCSKEIYGWMMSNKQSDLLLFSLLGELSGQTGPRVAE